MLKVFTWLLNDCGYPLDEAVLPSTHNLYRYPQLMFWNKNKENRYTAASRGPYTFHGYVFLVSMVLGTQRY